MSEYPDSSEQNGNNPADDRPGYETAFARVLKRQPTPVQLARIKRIAADLGLSDDDAIWSLLMACEYYLQLYGEHFETSEKRLKRAAREAMDELLTRHENQQTQGHGQPRQRFNPVWLLWAFMAGMAGSTGWLLVQIFLPRLL